MNANAKHVGNTGADSEVVIIGGGLAGLAAAMYIAPSGCSVRLLERQRRLGGLAATDVRDGFSFNQGAHALYVDGPGAEVLAELGIETKGGRPPTSGRLVMDGQAEIAPAGPISLARTRALSLSEKFDMAKLLAKLPKSNPADYADWSVSRWVRESVRGDKGQQLLFGLSRLATYTNNPDELSAEVAIEQLQYGLGNGVLYLDGGWQSLVDQMVNALESMSNVTLETGATVDELPDAPVVIIAAGGPILASRLLNQTFDLGPSAEVSCLDMGLKRTPDHDVVIGADEPFYFSNHSAVANLAPVGRFHVSAMEYLRPGAEPRPAAIEAFTRHAGIDQDDVVTSRRLHRMTAVSAIPTAKRGGLAGRPGTAVADRPGVFIAGDWVGPKGHLADASLASAKQAALGAVDHLAQIAPASAGR